MRKFFYSSPLALIASLLFTCGICYLMMNACRKMDYSNGKKDEIAITNQFLRVPANAPSSIKRIAAKIKQQNDEHKFIGRLAKELGIPNWDKSVIIFPPAQAGAATGATDIINGEGDGIWGTDTLAFIPLGKPGESWVSSFMACLVGDSNKVAIRLARGDRYPAYGMTRAMDTISAELIALQCMYLEYIASDYKDSIYRVNDLRLFKWDGMSSGNASRFIKFAQEEEPDEAAGGNTLNIQISPGVPCFGVSYMEWYNVMGYAPPEGTPNQIYVPGSYCIDYDLWLDYVLNGADSGGTIPGDEAGGGGGGDDWYDENICRVIPGQDPCGGVPSGGGWILVEGEDNVYDPNIYDTIAISNYIKDSFPCLYYFLKDSFQDANRIAQLAGVNLFKDSTLMHLHFAISDSTTQEGESSAYTGSGGVFVNGSGVTEYTATIYFNPWYLNHGTKEFMIHNIIHELMHAVFTLRWGQYKSWLTWHDTIYDSGYIKQHFPIYWYHYTGQPVPSTAISEHEMMALDYSNRYSDILRTFFNPAASTAVRDSVIKALSYGGLQRTTAWKLLPSQGMDTCKYKGVISAAEISATGSTVPPGCPGNYAYHYANDLSLRPNCN